MSAFFWRILFFDISLSNSGDYLWWARPVKRDSVPRFASEWQFYYFGWRERSGDSMKYNEDGQNRVFESPLLSPLCNIIVVSFRASARNRVPFYGTSSPKVISLTFDHLSFSYKSTYWICQLLWRPCSAFADECYRTAIERQNLIRSVLRS